MCCSQPGQASEPLPSLFLFRRGRAQTSGAGEAAEKQEGHVLRRRYGSPGHRGSCVSMLLRLYLTCLSLLCSGTDRESPNNVEKPPNRKPPVKKPRLPQNRNKSLDLSGTRLCLYSCVCVYVCVCVISNVFWTQWC